MSANCYMITNKNLLFRGIMCCHVQSLSCTWLFVTLWTVTYQAPLPMGVFRQEYWSGLPFPFLADLPNPEIEPTSLGSPALAGTFFTAEPSGRPPVHNHLHTQQFCYIEVMWKRIYFGQSTHPLHLCTSAFAEPTFRNILLWLAPGRGSSHFYSPLPKCHLIQEVFHDCYPHPSVWGFLARCTCLHFRSHLFCTGSPSPGTPSSSGQSRLCFNHMLIFSTQTMSNLPPPRHLVITHWRKK